MKPTRVRTLILVTLACAAGSWLLLPQIYSRLPPLPWTGVSVLLLAAAEAWSGRVLRARLRGQGRPVRPIAVARLAALAKATSLAAAVFAGLAAGFLLYVARDLEKPAFRSDAYVAASTVAANVLLAGAALYLEYGCRARPGDGTPPPGTSGPSR